MDIPPNVEVEIVNYLNVEYGANSEQEGVKTSDLKYEGEFLVDGKAVRYWAFPCTSSPGCWAVVEPYEGSYMISMTTAPPPRGK